MNSYTVQHQSSWHIDERFLHEIKFKQCSYLCPSLIHWVSVCTQILHHQMKPNTIRSSYFSSQRQLEYSWNRTTGCDWVYYFIIWIQRQCLRIIVKDHLHALINFSRVRCRKNHLGFIATVYTYYLVLNWYLISSHLTHLADWTSLLVFQQGNILPIYTSVKYFNKVEQTFGE